MSSSRQVWSLELLKRRRFFWRSLLFRCWQDSGALPEWKACSQSQSLSQQEVQPAGSRLEGDPCSESYAWGPSTFQQVKFALWHKQLCLWTWSVFSYAHDLECFPVEKVSNMERKGCVGSEWGLMGSWQHWDGWVSSLLIPFPGLWAFPLEGGGVGAVPTQWSQLGVSPFLEG